MAIITEARMQQLRGKYNQLNKEALLPGEFAICDDHNPIVRTNTGYKELLTADNAEYFENKVTDINNAISSTNEAVDKANKAVADTLQATNDNTQRVDNALTQLETDTQQKFTELDTQVTNTVNGAVSDLNEAKEQAISDMEQATNDNTQRVDNAIQQIATKVGIDDTQSSTLTTYSSDKIDKLFEGVSGKLPYKIVTSLPETGDENTLYFVPSTNPESNNVYDEYMYIDGMWEYIGSKSLKIDLSNYYNKNETDTLLANKVDKEEGKGLFSGSYNDLTDIPTNLVTNSELDKHVKANDEAKFYFGVLNHKFGYYTTEAREESDFHEFGSAGFHVPPKDVYNVSVKASDGALTVSWNDPDDTYIEGVDISHWAGTILVMKADTPPADENDGTVVLTNTVRNQYATNGYVIDGLINNTTYHLYFIPYNQEGDYEYSDSNRYTGMPAKVMLDDVTDISTSGADGSVTVNWTNPSQTKEQDGITATWVKTTVVVKADSQPTSATDGIVYESTDYSENSHTFTVDNGKDYYVGFFIESDLGSVTNTTYDTATSLYATVTITTEEVTLYGKSITATFGETQTLTSTFSDSGTTQFKIPYMGEVVFTSSNDIDTATSKLTIEEWKTYAVEMSFFKIVTFADGTDKEINAMIEAHYNDKINIADYWAVGDTRNVNLSAMSATGVGESHRAQTVQFVIGDFEHDDLVTSINGHTKAAVTLLQKDCLMDAANASNPTNGSGNTENGYMNSSNTNVGGWKSCARRTWCNNVYFSALPSALQSMVKTVNKKVSVGNNSSTIETVQDKIFLAAEIEIFGSTQYSFTGEGTQYQFYKNATANRYKMPKWNSSSVSNVHWERSPRSGNATYFCIVSSSGNADTISASTAYGVAPCLCI